MEVGVDQEMCSDVLAVPATKVEIEEEAKCSISVVWVEAEVQPVQVTLSTNEMENLVAAPVVALAAVVQRQVACLSCAWNPAWLGLLGVKDQILKVVWSEIVVLWLEAVVLIVVPGR